MKSTRFLGVLATTALALGTFVSPAQADYYNIADPDKRVPSLTDITGITARHGSENLSVKVRFVDVRRTSHAGMSIFIDSDRTRKGPELVLGTGLGDGTDYALTRARGWKRAGARVDCDYDLQIKWGQERARARVSRDCFDRAGLVRVSVKMTDVSDGSHPVIDWAPEARRWSLNIQAEERLTEARTVTR